LFISIPGLSVMQLPITRTLQLAIMILLFGIN